MTNPKDQIKTQVKIQFIREKYAGILKYFKKQDQLIQILLYSEELLIKPQEILFINYPFNYWKVIGNIKNKQNNTIRIGCLSSGQIYIKSAQKIWKDLDPIKNIHDIHPELINFDIFYSINHKKFINIDFLYQLGYSKLQKEIKNEILEEYDFFAHKNLHDTLIESYYKKLKLSISRFFASPGDNNFLDMTLNELFRNYYINPNERALKVREDIAKKFGFKYNRFSQEYIISNDKDKVAISSKIGAEGQVHINHRYICIDIQNKDLPTDDIIACKMLSLVIPNLRDQINTISLKEKRILKRIFGK